MLLLSHPELCQLQQTLIFAEHLYAALDYSRRLITDGKQNRKTELHISSKFFLVSWISFSYKVITYAMLVSDLTLYDKVVYPSFSSSLNERLVTFLL